MRVLRTVEELDEAIKLADCCETDEKLRAHLGSFAVDLESEKNVRSFFRVPAPDPFSDAYKKRVIRQYELIAGRQYQIENEHTPFDLGAALQRPFPYATRSPEVVCDYFVQAHRLMTLLDPARTRTVVDMGPGWGNTTEILARYGYRVHAIDVSKDFCTLIGKRLEQQGLTANVIHGDFFAIKQLRAIDAVLFFECFHHCLDHQELLREIWSRTAQDGKIIFGGEPVVPGQPVPWGVRQDGMASWSVRKFGWLELGFSEDYFLELLLRTGWAPGKHAFPGSPPAYSATKTARWYPGRIAWPSTCGWAAAESDASLTHRFATGQVRIPLKARRARLQVSNHRPRSLAAVVCGQRLKLQSEQSAVVEVEVQHGAVEVESQTWVPSKESGNPDARVLGVAIDWIEPAT